MDPDSVAWTGVATSANYINVNPYYPTTTTLFVDDSITHAGGVSILVNWRGGNGFLVSHTGYNPEIIPLNDTSSNSRSRQAYERFTYAMACVVAKFYQTTSPPNPSKYRYQHDRWAGQFGLNFYSNVIEPNGNEADKGFRGLKAYQTPEETFFQNDIMYDTLKALQPSLVILSQAYVSHNWSHLRATVKNAYLYYGYRKQLWDGISMHTTISSMEFDHDPTTNEFAGIHGDFPGAKNERKKFSDNHLSLCRDLGFFVPTYITEFSYTKDSVGPDSVNTFVSQIGAPQIKTHTKFENHSIMIFQAFAHYQGYPGNRGTYYYTVKDAANKDSSYYINIDNSDGLINTINVPEIIFPAYWYQQSFVKQFGNWRWSESIRNDLSGAFVDKYVLPGYPDSVMLLVMNQGKVDGAPVYIAVNNTSAITKYYPSFTSMTMGTGSQSSSGGFILVTPRPEGDMYVFAATSGSINVRFRRYDGLKKL
jgi:hypothetical protein